MTFAMDGQVGTPDGLSYDTTSCLSERPLYGCSKRWTRSPRLVGIVTRYVIIEEIEVFCEEGVAMRDVTVTS